MALFAKSKAGQAPEKESQDTSKGGNMPPERRQGPPPARKAPPGEGPPLKRSGPPPGTRPAPANNATTVIHADTLIEGKIHAKNELQLDGRFKGEIFSSSRVIVGTGGNLEASVEANSMVISGKVTGNLRISDRLELLSTGELVGDLETQPGALIIEKGARLEGRCNMTLKSGDLKFAQEKEKSSGGSGSASQSAPQSGAQTAPAPKVEKGGEKPGSIKK